MAGAYDANKKPIADKDPTQTIQWQIQKMAQTLWESVVSAIQAAFDTVKEWATTLFDGVFYALVGMNTDEVLDLLISNPLGFIPIMIGRLINQGLLGVKSLISAFNIVGLLQSWNIPFLSLSSIGNTHPNLLVQPGFDAEDSIEFAGDGWYWDSEVGRTKPGCARAEASATGIERMMTSVPIPVGEGQVIDASVWVKWSGLSYTGTDPITVDLIRYDDDLTELSRTTLKTIGSPATSGPNWFQIDCPEYTIPDDGTSQIKLQFRVRSTMTAGKVWWDDAVLKKSNSSIPQNWILNLVPDLGGIRQWIQDLIDGIISAIRGIPFVGGTLAHIITYITGWKEDTDHAASQASDAYIGLDVTQKIVVAAATGAPLAATVVTTDQDQDVKNALEAQTSTIVAQGALLDQLQSQITSGGNSGVLALDLFEETYTGQLNPALWQSFWLEGTSSDAYYDTNNGHDASLVWPSGSPTATVLNRFIGEGEHTLSNFQKVTLTMAGSFSYAWLDGRRPHEAVYCRVSDDGTKWVRAYITNNKALIVDYQNGASSGVLYNSGGDSVSWPGPGSTLVIEPGVNGDQWSFRIWRGNTPLRIVTDTSHVTDPTPKGHGFGGRVSGGWGPPSYTQYSAVDNTPAAIPGYGFRVYRADTSAVGYGAGDQIMAFDTVTYDTDGGWDPVLQQYTVPETGWWIVKTRCGLNSTSQTNNSLDPSVVDLRADGAIIELGQSGLIRNLQWAGSSNDSVNGIFGPLPLVKGQKLTTWMNYSRTNNSRVIGDALGSKTFFAGSLVSKGR